MRPACGKVALIIFVLVDSGSSGIEPQYANLLCRAARFINKRGTQRESKEAMLWKGIIQLSIVFVRRELYRDHKPQHRHWSLKVLKLNISINIYKYTIKVLMI